jgi:hypothetical protein
LSIHQTKAICPIKAKADVVLKGCSHLVIKLATQLRGKGSTGTKRIRFATEACLVGRKSGERTGNILIEGETN